MENYREDLLLVISERLQDESTKSEGTILDFDGIYTLPDGQTLEWGFYMDIDIKGAETLAVSLSNGDEQTEEWLDEKLEPLAWELHDQMIERLEEEEEWLLEYDRADKEYYDRMLAEWPASVIH